MPVFDHFGAIAPLYDRIFGRSDPQKRHELLNLTTGMHLLDAGGGTGRVSQQLDCPVCNLIVADESMGMLREAILKPILKPVQSKVEELPFQDFSFDRILMVDALHHVFNAKKSMEELFRVLKVDGLLIIEEPDIRFFAVKLIALAEKILLMRSHFLRPDQIKDLFMGLPAEVHVETEDATSWIIVKRIF